MSDLICRKTMMRCQTPGMCSPHGGCSTGILKAASACHSPTIQPTEADGVERYDWTYDEMAESQDGNYVRHGDYDAVTAELGELKDSMAFRSSRIGRVEAERDQLRAEVERLRKDAARYQWLRGRLPGSAYRIAGVIYSEGGEGVDAAIEAAMAAKEGV